MLSKNDILAERCSLQARSADATRSTALMASEQPLIGRLRSTAGHRRAGFSLVELVVSIGVLLVILALTGEVLSVTVNTTGQATALTEVNQELRFLESKLRQDLAGVRKGESLLVIQANPINAYWNQDGLDADDDTDPINGYPGTLGPHIDNAVDPNLKAPPRADVLMFFSAGATKSYVQYTYGKGVNFPPTVTSGLRQVVYGHANLGEYRPDPNSLAGGGGSSAVEYLFDKGEDAFPLFPAPSRVPAQKWHLARRSVLLLPSGLTAAVPPWANGDVADPDFGGLGAIELLKGTTDVMSEFNYTRMVLTPPLLDDPSQDPIFKGIRYWPRALTQAVPYLRSDMDPTPPPRLADRLGHYFLPNCASFKVEWSLDPRSAFVSGRLDDERDILWIDQGNLGADPLDAADDDPLAALTQAFDEAEADPAQALRAEALRQLKEDLLGGNAAYSLEERFTGPPKGDLANWGSPDAIYGPTDVPRLAVFTAKRRDDNDNVIDEDIFPVALRITIDLYDDLARLGRPIRHVMVIPLGS